MAINHAEMQQFQMTSKSFKNQPVMYAREKQSNNQND